MDLSRAILTVFCLLCASSTVLCVFPRYETKYIALPVNQFDSTNKNTFELRYLINDTFTRGNPDSPILFYCGNEADIEFFANVTGFMWELAPTINALVVFAEHRYYGRSLPLGRDFANPKEHFKFLTIEQTLADFATLLQYLNKDATKNRPTIAIGGSYGGILAALFRIKYPHLLAGALAASAPLKQFSDLTPCDKYSQTITRTFRTACNEHCASNVEKSWTVFRDVAGEDDGVVFFNQVFNFCAPLQNAEQVKDMLDSMDDMYWKMSMTNYPYTADVYTPLPSNPVMKFCSCLDLEYDGRELVKAFRRALDVYTNPYGLKKCFEFPHRSVMQDYESRAWGFQRCTELLTGMCVTEGNNMFSPGGDNFTDLIDQCRSSYGKQVDQDVNRINNLFEVDSLRTATKIIFSNGLLDPWSAASVLSAPNNQTLVINIPEGAHHIDLRFPDEMDPPSVTRARALEKHQIKKWIRDFRKQSFHFM